MDELEKVEQRWDVFFARFVRMRMRGEQHYALGCISIPAGTIAPSVDAYTHFRARGRARGQELVGGLNPEFKEQTAAFLGSMGMDAGTFRDVLSEAHEIMRRDAEEERALNP